jgi:hypothetical protein
MRKHYGKLATCGFVLGLLLLAGCPSPQQKLPENTGDPLVGPEGLTIPKQGPAPVSQASAVSIQTPLPLTNPNSSVAGMAVGAPLTGGRQTIGIPVANEGSGKKTWQESDAGKTVLKQPQPIVENGAVVQPVPVYNTTPATGDATLQQLKAQLTAKGAVFQNTVHVSGGVQFICIVPNPQSPDSLRTYQVTAVDAVTAARAVLEKINQGQ